MKLGLSLGDFSPQNTSSITIIKIGLVEATPIYLKYCCPDTVII